MANKNYNSNFCDISCPAPDFRESREFIEFTQKVLAVVDKLKGGATYRQLNGRFPNQGNWLNEAIESLDMSGKIRRTGSVSITRFVIGGKSMQPLPKLSKSDYTAGIKRVHEWRKTNF